MANLSFRALALKWDGTHDETDSGTNGAKSLHSHWRLADDRNVLYLSPTGETDAEKTVELSPEQAGRIREITAITSSLLITLLIEKQVTAVHW